MNEFPKSVTNAVAKSADKYGDDIEKAVGEAEKRVRKLKAFSEFEGQLVRHALRELIYDARHQKNGQIKEASRNTTGPSKVVSGSSPAVTQAYREAYYDYCIAGMTLGKLQGEMLADIAESEQNIATGHLFNVRLCERLVKIVPEGKTVEQCVSEKKLKVIFQELS